MKKKETKKEKESKVIALNIKNHRHKMPALPVIPLTGSMTYPLETKDFGKIIPCPKCGNRLRSYLQHLHGVTYFTWDHCEKCGYETEKLIEHRIVAAVIPSENNSIEISRLDESTLALYLESEQSESKQIKESWVYVNPKDTKIEWGKKYAVVLFCQGDMQGNLVPLTSIRATNIEGNFVLGRITGIGTKLD